MRGVSSLRPRANNIEKFCGNIINARKVSEGCDGRNFLGKNWCKKRGYEIHEDGNYYVYPTLTQIKEGMLIEAELQLK
jgi:hypothetical protein